MQGARLNMDSLRRIAAISSVTLLALGYAASQRAYFAGEWQSYAEKVDSPPVSMVAAVWMLFLIGLYLLPGRRQEEES